MPNQQGLTVIWRRLCFLKMALTSGCFLSDFSVAGADVIMNGPFIEGSPTLLKVARGTATMTTKDLAIIILRVLKQAINAFAKEIGEEVSCQRCRRIERDYDLTPKKK